MFLYISSPSDLEVKQVSMGNDSSGESVLSSVLKPVSDETESDIYCPNDLPSTSEPVPSTPSDDVSKLIQDVIAQTRFVDISHFCCYADSLIVFYNVLKCFYFLVI